VYIGAIAAFLSIRSVADYVARLTWPHRSLLGSLLALLLLGQIANRPRLTFPFSAWAMYCKPERSTDTLVYYRYEGLGENGEAVELDPFRLLALIPQDGVSTKIKDLAEQVEKPASKEQLAALLRTVGAVHSRRSPERPLSRVTPIGCSLDLRQGREAQVSRESRLRADL